MPRPCLTAPCHPIRAQVCQRLLPYKEDTAGLLLRSLQLVVALPPGVYRDLGARIAAEVRSAGFFPGDWGRGQRCAGSCLPGWLGPSGPGEPGTPG